MTEASAPHPLEQFLVLGEVHAGLGYKGEWMIVTLRPVCQDREQAFDVALVADKVIINDEYHPAPANPQERIQFGHYLLITLRARNAAIDLDDVAELALKRTAARVLDRHRAIASEVNQLEVGDGRRGECRPLGSLIDALRLPTLEVADELWQGHLGLAEEDMVGLR